MDYYINLENISIDEYREILKSADLLPSRMILKENIDDVFRIIKDQGVSNVDELLNTLKNKKKLLEFSTQSGIQEDYLTILIREVKSYRQSPNKIRDFPGVSEDDVSSLEKIGIKHTQHLYDKILTPRSRKELSDQTGISEQEILRLAKLSDLSRIRWVNHTFAYVLYEAGYDIAKKVADADFNDLYEDVKKLNEERKLYNAHIGLHDMVLTVQAANDISFDVEYVSSPTGSNKKYAAQ
jgi:hypothetical protein